MFREDRHAAAENFVAEAPPPQMEKLAGSFFLVMQNNGFIL